MSEQSIAGKKVAFLLTDGVEQVELTSPWQAVKDAGGQPTPAAEASPSTRHGSSLACMRTRLGSQAAWL